jgi:hypothetical protein
MGTTLTRRDVLVGGLRALTVLPAVALTGGCGGRTDCSDTSGLAPADAQMRSAQNYLETSPDPAKACDICEQYVPPEKSGCGACKVLKGGVNPKGSCNLFVKKA